MDSLDCNLQAEILRKIALHSSKQQGKQQIIQDRLPSLASLGEHPIAAVIIAFAQVAERTQDAKDQAKVREYLEKVCEIRLEAVYGVQPQDWPLADNLAFALTSAVLSAESGNCGEIVLKTLKKLVKLSTDDATDNTTLVTRLLPTLNGVSRACMHQKVALSAGDTIELVRLACTVTGNGPLSPNLVRQTSASAAQTAPLISTYAALGVSLDSSLVTSALMSIASVSMQAFFLEAHKVSKTASEIDWATTQLFRLSHYTFDGQKLAEFEEAGALALEKHFQLQATQPQRDSIYDNETSLSVSTGLGLLRDSFVSFPLEAVELIRKQIAALAYSLASVNLEHLLQTAFTACEHVELSPEELMVYLPSLYITLLADTNTAQVIGKNIRNLLTNANTAFSYQPGHNPPVALEMAAHIYVKAVTIFPTHESVPSTIYSLLNATSQEERSGGSIRHSLLHLPNSLRSRPKSESRSMSVSGVEDPQIAAAALYTVTCLAEANKSDREVVSVCITLLSQRLSGNDQTAAPYVLDALASLAPSSNAEQFDNIVKSLIDYSESVHLGDSHHSAALSAQTKVARTISKVNSERAEIYLHALLQAFSGFHSSKQDNTGTDHAISSLAVIAHVLLTNNIETAETENTDLVVLFRNMWFTCTAIGLFSETELTEYQKDILVMIASHTPCLIKVASPDYIEGDLEYNSILRGPKNQSHYERARHELSAALPHRSGQFRSVSGPQIMFLLTVLRVEKMRTRSGHFAQSVHYFHNEGINASPIAECLEGIIDEVEKTYRSILSARVALQALTPLAVEEMQNLAVQCCHTSSKTRRMAVAYFSDLVNQFPCLLCSKPLVTCLLEILTLLRRACESFHFSKYTPVYQFHSQRAGITLTLDDNAETRDKLLSTMHTMIRGWLQAMFSRTPVECQSILQHYIDTTGQSSTYQDSEMGRSVAIDLARTSPSTSRYGLLPTIGGWQSDMSTVFTTTYASRAMFLGEAKAGFDISNAKEQLRQLESLTDGELRRKFVDLRETLYRVAAHLVHTNSADYDLIHYLVSIPVRKFTLSAVTAGAEVWSWLADRMPELESKIMTEISLAWSWTMRRQRGFFDKSCDLQHPFEMETQYTPSDQQAMVANERTAQTLLAPHSLLLNFISSRFQSYRYWDPRLTAAARRLIMRSLDAHRRWSRHPLARELRLRFLSFGFSVLHSSQMEAKCESRIRKALYAASLDWFMLAPVWSYGSNTVQITADLRHVSQLEQLVKVDSAPSSMLLSSRQSPSQLNDRQSTTNLEEQRDLLMHLLTNERSRLATWANPTGPSQSENYRPKSRRSLVEIAWSVDPLLAARVVERDGGKEARRTLSNLLRANPHAASHVPDLVPLLLDRSLFRAAPIELLFWTAVPPISAIQFLSPKYSSDPIVMQYAMRVLEQHPIKQTFFYIPQIVQGLRTDDLAYVERFIFEAAAISQLFCHQIIWNMRANCYKDDNAEPDPMKPAFESMSDLVIQSLSGEAQSFYKREFDFFAEVTSISKKLQPFIKKSKAEKKAKIDQEMQEIKLDVGVYLPSNPDGVVVDIDRSSGRPLQSHAKAPFMATFKVRRELTPATIDTDAPDQDVAAPSSSDSVDVWQSAIFKVGDDCRQDVLALQIIAQFKTIFANNGLALHLVPYRVTATGPGQGVIDVIPNATSRDEMGRAKVNNLLSFFRGRFGSEESMQFQQARNKFIQSMAAYSVICYIIQIKDRHNGNIMINGEGHITHIGTTKTKDMQGIKFEPNSFKLTHEMVDVMGGVDSSGFAIFKELTIKAFLACRPYSEEICATAHLMIGTDLPSFKGEATIDRLRDRFKPDMSESEATHYMAGVISNAQFSGRSILYDRFQKYTNDIPFAK